MRSPEVVDARGPSKLREPHGDWSTSPAARRDLVLPDPRLGPRLVGDHRGAPQTWRGVVRGLGRLEALVALEPRIAYACIAGSRSTCPSTSTRAVAPGPRTIAAGSCRRLARRGRRVARRGHRGARASCCAAPTRLGRATATARRAGYRETACPRMSVPPPDQAGGTLPRLQSAARARFTRRIEREGVLFEWVATGSVDVHAVARPFSSCMRERVRAMRLASSFGLEQLALHRRLAERSGAGCGPRPWWRDATARRGVLYGFSWKDTFAAYQWGWDARGTATAWAACSPTRPFASPRHRCPHVRLPARDRAVQVSLRSRRPVGSTWLLPHGPRGALLAARYRAGDLAHRSGGHAAVRRARRPAYSRSYRGPPDARP